MNLKCTRKTEVFCDWLDVTCSPEQSFISEVQYALDSFGGSIEDIDVNGVTRYRLGKGVALLKSSKHYHKVSLSGAVLKHVRYLDKLDYLLSAIGTVPHNVTRLDAALDTDQDGSEVYSHFEKRFSRVDRYPRLTRKTVKPRYYSSNRESDGNRTGTVYIGNLRSKVSAKIYDKQEEALQRGEQLPPTTRYELTVRKDMKPSLRDASAPTAIFWHYMGETLLKRPSDVPVWDTQSNWSWNMSVEKPLVYQVLKSKVENSADLLRMFELAESMSPDGAKILLNLIQRSHVDSTSISSKQSA